MVEYFSKFEGDDMKIAVVNSIHVTKQINFLQSRHCLPVTSWSIAYQSSPPGNSLHLGDVELKKAQRIPQNSSNLSSIEHII